MFQVYYEIKKYLIILTCIVVLSGCKRQITDSTPSQLNYEIVFTSYRDGNQEIYVMNSDGSNQTRLTNNTVKDWFPKWSPDGERIAYFSRNEGSTQLFIMNKDGSNRRQIGGNMIIQGGYEWLEWSPDNIYIAFQSFSNQSTLQISVVNCNESNQKFQTDGNSPNWTIQNKIIFCRNGFYSINPDGSELVQIAGDTLLGFRPVVSPFSDKIIFNSFRDNDIGSASLHIMNFDGSNLYEISNKYAVAKPTWAPNNFEILFLATEMNTGKDKIFKVNTKNNNEENISDTGLIASPPVYSPNGERIVFAALTEDPVRIDIYVKNLLDGKISRLTHDKSAFPTNDNPDWNPTTQ